MSTQVTRVWWDGDKLMAQPISETEFYKPEPVTEWLTCPKCSHKSPYSPIKAKTLAEEAEQITKRARAVLEAERQAREPLTDRESSLIRFALHRFMTDAYAQLNAAAQDKNNRHYKAGAVEAFAKDAKDADALLAKLTAAHGIGEKK